MLYVYSVVVFFSTDDEEVNIVGFFSDPLVRVVRVVRGEGEGGGPSLVVCYDATTRRHSVWALKEARLEVRPYTHSSSGSTCISVTCLIYVFQPSSLIVFTKHSQN